MTGSSLVHYGSVFFSGNSQAVRLPKEYQLSCQKVQIRKIGDMLLLSPEQKNSWDDFFDNSLIASDDFMQFARNEPPQEREF